MQIEVLPTFSPPVLLKNISIEYAFKMHFR